jgi:hypothetical protein
MSFQILNYEYFLDGYTDKPFSHKEYKTASISNNNNNNNNKNTCHLITAKSNNEYNEYKEYKKKYYYDNSDTSDISTISDISTLSLSNISDISSISKSSSTTSISSLSNMTNNNDNYIHRSCDHFSGNIVETEEDLELEIEDTNKELNFTLNFGDISISSYDLIKMTNKFGSKKLQKNYKFNEIIKHFGETNVMKLYEKNSALKIIKKVQEILKKFLPKESNKIEIINFNSIYEKTENNIKSENLKIVQYFSYIENFIYNLYSQQKLNDYTFVRWFEPEYKDKIIILGDFHGSFSTFVRHLLRFKKMKILDEKGKLAEGYYLLFLGDIVDRGIYSYEILMILYLLIINNPDQIILNNGNHEELTTNGKINKSIYNNIDILDHNSYVGNFINEILGKYQNLKDMLEIYTEIQNIMLLQPSAILCKEPNNNIIYMSHGCLPHDKNDKNKLNSFFKDKLKEKKSFYIHNDIGTSIRWNDFFGENNTSASRRTLGDNPLIQKIGKYVLDDAKTVGISMIIRGHEDLHYNTKIIKEGNKNWESIKNKNQNLKCNFKSKSDIFGNMTNIVKLDEKSKKLIIDNQSTNYLPILTISTNTDIGKNLTSDSYIILTFDNSIRELNCNPDIIQNGGNLSRYKFNKYAEKNQKK